MAEFELFVSKEDFKFSCAHFIAHDGFRERLHGHNYTVGVKLTGSDLLNDDGYLIDFGVIKRETREICRSITERFICPMRSKSINITEEEGQICLLCEDGARFSFPKGDCALLPLVHSSAEELAHWLWYTLIRKFGLEKLSQGGIRVVEVSVLEGPMQSALYRAPLPVDEDALVIAENRTLFRAPSRCCAAPGDH